MKIQIDVELTDGSRSVALGVCHCRGVEIPGLDEDSGPGCRAYDVTYRPAWAAARENSANLGSRCSDGEMAARQKDQRKQQPDHHPNIWCSWIGKDALGDNRNARHTVCFAQERKFTEGWSVLEIEKYYRELEIDAESISRGKISASALPKVGMRGFPSKILGNWVLRTLEGRRTRKCSIKIVLTLEYLIRIFLTPNSAFHIA
ncbi:hypothetical protein B0H16DRAFT_1474509 [Mycena metata]|uniref:Uncharacterized protein n=1 Tax=Mycena metata TaxID=1033252 RepID=A0AAD7HGQ5_9AGAR|nr:hypothetical protein B0H16DRAFT_1474509 [Mycena metata]